MSKRKLKKKMAKQAAKKIQVKQAPKDELPKEELSKQEPPKEELPKEDPQKEELPKEDIPKEEPDKVKFFEEEQKPSAPDKVDEVAQTASAPKVIKGYSNRRIFAAMCMCVAFALIYSVLITPYANVKAKSDISDTETTTTKASTATTETTTETTETTTLKPAVPVTKVFKPKRVAPKVTQPVRSAMISGVPYVSQLPSYPTGCEAASATMLLRFYGFNVSLSEMVRAIPRENLYEENGRVYGPSIYEKFVGDPSGSYTSPTRGFGAFPPVVARAMNRVMARHGGGHVAKNITGSSVDTLFRYLDEGKPLIVWSTYRMNTPKYVNSWYIKTPKGDKYFEYPRGTHVTVLVGYDSRYVYMQDPYRRENRKFRISSFAEKYAFLNYQAIVIEGGVTPTEAKVDTSKLEKAIKDFEGKYKRSDNLRSDGQTPTNEWKLYEKELKASKAKLNDEHATQKEIDALLKSLVSAAKKLHQPTDFTGLNALVETSEKKFKKDDFETILWNKYETELNSAKDVLKNKDATQKDVDEALEKLEKVVKELEQVLNPTDPTDPTDSTKPSDSTKPESTTKAQTTTTKPETKPETNPETNSKVNP